MKRKKYIIFRLCLPLNLRLCSLVLYKHLKLEIFWESAGDDVEKVAAPVRFTGGE